MEIQWYWPAEQMGLVKDLRQLYDDGSTWQVSAQADEVFAWIGFSLAVLVMLLVFLLRFFGARGTWERTARRIQAAVTVLVLIRAVLVAVGIGPYVQFYPTGGGFLDLSTLEHILSGILWALLAAAVFFFGKLGHFCGTRIKTKQNRKKGNPSDET